MTLTANEIKQRRTTGSYRADRHGPSKTDEPLALRKPKHRKSPGSGCADEWIRNVSDERAVESGCWFDLRFASFAREWIETYLRLWEGEWHGKPFKLLDWQWREVVAPLFGWLRWDDDRGRPVRRFDRGYIEVPKKNGKSPLAAAIGCHLLCGDEDHGNGIFSAGVKRDQAAIVHRHAVNMIESSPELLKRVKLNRSTHACEYLPTKSIYRALASEAGGAEGLNGSVIIDELHAWHGRAFYDSLRYMGASRAEPLIFQITTAGDDLQGICWEQHEHAEAVNAGVVADDGFLGYVCGVDESDDISDEATWTKANPSMGHTVFVREMSSAYEEAKGRLTKLNAFRRYRLNQWVATESQWLDPDKWAACSAEYELSDLKGDLYAGLDLSRTRDMTAFTLCGLVDGVPAIWPRLWMAETWKDELRKTFPKIGEWIAAGLVTVITGDMVDYAIVLDDVKELLKSVGMQRVKELRFDRRFASDSVVRFRDETRIEVVDFPQNETHYTGPLQEMERRVLGGQIRHPGHDVLNWQVSHCLAKEGDRGVILKKRKTGDYRTIDGVVASVMAFSGLMDAGLLSDGSVYRERGVLSL